MSWRPKPWKNHARFLKPTTQYLAPIRKPKLPNPATRRLALEKTSTLSTTNNAAGGGLAVPQCKRITFRIHPSAADSFHAREYISHRLADTASKHSTTSFYVTQSSTRMPILAAHYLNGYTEEQRIDNVNEEVIVQFIEKYCGYSGDIQKGRMNRQQKVEGTKSIQGMWNPYLNAPQPNLNAPRSTQEIKNDYRAEINYAKYRGIPPDDYKDKLER